jgi:hypothetical protein
MGPVDMPLTDVLPPASATAEQPPLPLAETTAEHPPQSYDLDKVISQLDVAARIANANLAYQNALQMQQALFHVQLAAVGKCTEMILQIDARSPDAKEQLASYESIMQMLTAQFEQMIEKVRVN